MTSGVSGAIESSQASVGFGSPGCNSASQPFRYAPSAPARGNLVADRGHDHVGVGHHHWPDVDETTAENHRLHQRMTVRLNQTRHHAAVTEVDGAGVRPDPRFDVGALPHRDDPPVGHGERLGGGQLLVDGENGSDEDHIGRGHGLIVSRPTYTHRDIDDN